jgi:SAM-dependent methyltransferase
MKEHFDNKFIDNIDEKIGDNYFSPILDYVFDQIKVNDVCDIGCGNGVFTGDLKRRIDCNLIGVDSNKYALEQASKLDFDKLIQVDDFTKDKLPIDNESVDLVICKDVLEHLIDPEFLTHEIFRILKPGGYFLVHVPNHFPIWGRLKFLFTNNIDTFSYFPNANRYDFPHIRFFTLDSMKDILKVSGFASLENISYFFTKPPIIHRFMPISLTKKMAQISTDNFSEGITILSSKA